MSVHKDEDAGLQKTDNGNLPDFGQRNVTQNN
jgi:hypothetical protein